ncbi:MAG: YncE family protein [Acidobacteriota bacterium]
MRNKLPEAAVFLALTLGTLGLFPRTAGGSPPDAHETPTASPAATPPPSGARPAAAQGYSVTDRIPLPGDTGWDYVTVDPAAGRLYVSRSDRVLVVDLASKKVVGEIAPTPGVHGVALVPSLGRGFTSNGRASSATAFSLATLEPAGQVATGENPDAILYDPASNRVFTFNGRGKSATAIDPKSLAVVGTIPLGGKPESGVSDGKGRVWVNIEDTGEIAVIDSRALKVAARWPVAGCEEPSGLAMDAPHRRLFTVCGNKVMAILDADSGRVVASLPIGDGVDAAGFDPATGLAFASNGEGTLTVVHEETPDRFRVVENVPTKRGARTMALDPTTHRIYLVTSDFGPPPPPTAERPRPRPSIVPGSVTVLVVSPSR